MHNADIRYGQLDEEATFYTLLLIDPVCLLDVLLFSLGVRAGLSCQFNLSLCLRWTLALRFPSTGTRPCGRGLLRCLRESEHHLPDRCLINAVVYQRNSVITHATDDVT